MRKSLPSGSCGRGSPPGVRRRSTKVGLWRFLSPAEHNAGCAVRTLFNSACSNVRSNIHRAYFHAPAAERCYWHEIAATILPDLRGSSPKLPAVTIIVSLHRSSPEPLMSALGQKQTSAHARPRHVRFTPKSGHWNPVAKCPLCAESGHHMNMTRALCLALQRRAVIVRGRKLATSSVL